MYGIEWPAIVPMGLNIHSVLQFPEYGWAACPSLEYFLQGPLIRDTGSSCIGQDDPFLHFKVTSINPGDVPGWERAKPEQPAVWLARRSDRGSRQLYWLRKERSLIMLALRWASWVYV
jgi:hypothetical protein